MTSAVNEASIVIRSKIRIVCSAVSSANLVVVR